MKIITGYTASKHITAADDAGLIKGIVGKNNYVLPVGSEFKATVVSSTEIRIADGELVMQGRHARIESGYDTLPITNGTQNQKRNDLIVARYTMDASTRVENIGLVVIKGTAGSTGVDPVYNTGDIDNGEMRDFPLYRVKLNGVNIEGVDKLFATTMSMEEQLNLIDAVKPRLLWENPLPTQAFPGQNITLLGKAAPLYIVEFRVTTSIARFITVMAAENKDTDVTWTEGFHVAGELTYHARKFVIKSGTAYFEEGTLKKSNKLTEITNSLNELIPTRIFGVDTIDGQIV